MNIISATISALMNHEACPVNIVLMLGETLPCAIALGTAIAVVKTRYGIISHLHTPYSL